MTEKDFGQMFMGLASTLQYRGYDTAEVKAYFGALSDVSEKALRTAAGAFSRESGRKWMPTAGEWRGEALKASEAARVAALPETSHDARYCCLRCEDTGMDQFDPMTGKVHTCPETPCGRSQKHGPHTWCRPCACRDANPIYQRKQAALAGKVVAA